MNDSKIVIRSFPNAEFGETAVTQLGAAGVWCELVHSDGAESQMDLPSEVGNVHLVVMENDAKRALHVITSDWHSDVGPNDRPARCPSCGGASYRPTLSFSVIISLQLLGLVMLTATQASRAVLWVTVPFVMLSLFILGQGYFSVKCNACGHKGFAKHFRVKLLK